MSKRKSITVLGVLLVVFLALLLMVNAKKPEDTPGNPHDDLAECEERVVALEEENDMLKWQIAQYEDRITDLLNEVDYLENSLLSCDNCYKDCCTQFENKVGYPPELCPYPMPE